MSNNEKYENAPADIAEAIEQAEVVPDFLPPPEQPLPPQRPGPLRSASSASSVKHQE